MASLVCPMGHDGWHHSSNPSGRPMKAENISKITIRSQNWQHALSLWPELPSTGVSRLSRPETAKKISPKNVLQKHPQDNFSLQNVNRHPPNVNWHPPKQDWRPPVCSFHTELHKNLPSPIYVMEGVNFPCPIRLDDRGTGQWKWLDEVPRRTSLVPLAFPCFVLRLIEVETEGLLDYQGGRGIISIVRWDLRPVIFGVEICILEAELSWGCFMETGRTPKVSPRKGSVLWLSCRPPKNPFWDLSGDCGLRMARRLLQVAARIATLSLNCRPRMRPLPDRWLVKQNLRMIALWACTHLVGLHTHTHIYIYNI